MNHKKKEAWKIIVGIVSILYIIFMWVKKDIVGIYNTMPQEQIIPLITTTVLVTLAKIIVLAVIIFFVKWVVKPIHFTIMTELSFILVVITKNLCYTQIILK